MKITYIVPKIAGVKAHELGRNGRPLCGASYRPEAFVKADSYGGHKLCKNCDDRHNGTGLNQTLMARANVRGVMYKSAILLLLSLPIHAETKLPPIKVSEKQAIYALCADFRDSMSNEYRADFLKRLLKAQDDGEVLKIKQDAGVPQACIEADEY